MLVRSQEMAKYVLDVFFGTADSSVLIGFVKACGKSRGSV